MIGTWVDLAGRWVNMAERLQAGWWVSSTLLVEFGMCTLFENRDQLC